MCATVCTLHIKLMLVYCIICFLFFSCIYVTCEGELFDMLRSVSHNSFPVVDDKSHDALIGTVSRKVLCTLLKHRAFAPISAIAHFYRDAALQGENKLRF